MSKRNWQAVEAAEIGAQQWRTVVHAQRAATPNHGDFYEIAAEAADTLRGLSALAGVLARQVAGYGKGRVLRDDEGWDPAGRIAEAAAFAAVMQRDLDHAARSADRFQSMVGHIAVEVTQ